MKTRHLKAITRFYIIFPYICYQTLCQSEPPRLKISDFLSRFGPKSQNIAKLCTRFRNSGVLSSSLYRSTTWVDLLKRALAPLRRIVCRDLEVFECFHNSSRPRLFVVHDRLECGHVATSLLWEFLDLVNAYTTNPDVKAKHHRCHECLTLTAKKPVQSVTTVKTAVA